MHVPEQFHQVHDWTCFAFGYLTNGALLWLIAYRTEAEAFPYRPILLLATLTDLAYLAVYAVVVPVLATDGGLSAVNSVGPLGWVPQPYNFALVVTWAFFFIFSLFSLCVPFIYRYAVICCGKSYGVGNFIVMLAVPFTFTLGFVGILVYAGYPSTEEYQQRGREFFFNESSVTRRNQPYEMGFLALDEARNNVVALYAMVLTAANYTLVFTCGWLIYVRLKHETTTNLSEKRARVFNQQVGRALLLQALVPLVVETVPTFLTCVGSLAGMKMGHFAIYFAAVLAWTPVVNPLIPLWVVGSYRREVCKWMRGGQTTITSTPVTLLSKQPSQQRK